MCSCQNVKFGTYSASIPIRTPWGQLRDIDFCVCREVIGLWDLGIETIESCCGHNHKTGYIAVSPRYEAKMEQLGYLRDPLAPHVFLTKRK